MDPQYSNGAGSSSPDFVKKLFKMLENSSYRDIVRWSDTGDSFIVVDTNEFTRHVLPKHFKHSNFASFVRQLNKYDFHKVRHNDDFGSTSQGDGSWEFKHVDFQVHNKDQLENIKRKTPSQKRSSTAQADENSAQRIDRLNDQISSLKKMQNMMNGHLQGLSTNYQNVISDMVSFQRNMAAQDNVMQNLISYLVQLEGGKSKDEKTGAPFVPSEQAQKLIKSYTEVAKASFEQMNEMTKRAAHMASSPSPAGNDGARLDPESQTTTEYFNDPAVKLEDFPQQAEKGGLRVFTVGHLAPRQVTAHDPAFDGVSNTMTNPPPSKMPVVRSEDSQGNTFMRVRRNTFVPGWAVPPKVLLVEDDAVCRKLSSKFLQVFGCDIDMAVDGVSAVNKMNLAKYDLVLMDIVMPNLDGVSATSLIRQFDPLTPIISMTSNVQSGDVMTYFSNGMNDILPKPFTKDGLLGMLEKHLIHLKVIKEMKQAPKDVNPPQIMHLGDEYGIEKNSAKGPNGRKRPLRDDNFIQYQQRTNTTTAAKTGQSQNREPNTRVSQHQGPYVEHEQSRSSHGSAENQQVGTTSLKPPESFTESSLSPTDHGPDCDDFSHYEEQMESMNSVESSFSGDEYTEQDYLNMLSSLMHQSPGPVREHGAFDASQMPQNPAFEVGEGYKFSYDDSSQNRPDKRSRYGES